MDASTFVARLAPLAAIAGVSTAIAISGAGVAVAEPSGVDSPPSAQPDDSASSSAAADEGRGNSQAFDEGDTDQTSETTVASVGSADALTTEEPVAAIIAVEETAAQTPEPTADSVAEDELEALSEDVEPQADPIELIDPETTVSDVPTALGATASTEGTEAPDTASGPERRSAQPSAADAIAIAAAQPANPIGDFFAAIAAFFNNQTPTLNPTQTGQTADGLVSGELNAVDPDSSTLTYTVSANPVRGTVAINADGGYLYTPDQMYAQSGTTDTFRVTVSDAASGFAIHGFMGLLHLLTFGVFGSSGNTSTRTVSVAVAPFALPTPPVTTPPVTTPPVTTPPVTTPPVTTPPVTTPPVTTPPVNTPPVTGSLAAFPGAEGFGSSATGGRGGSVVYVTNTNASGVGSLQWAIDQPGAKYILFKVSGLIDTQIHLTNGNVTIAGQSSPGGITIRGFVTDETPYQDQTVRAPSDFAENWILQHVRIRPGLDGRSDDGLRLRYTRNAVVDHLSIGNATDEAVEISYSNNITIQNTIIAETLGGHAFYGGVLMNYSNPAHGFGLDNISLHHNIFNRIEGRLPEGSRESLAAANSTMNLELSNNLYWDPRFFIALGVNTNVVTDSRGNPYPIYWKLNAVNNFFRTGSQFQYGMFDDQILRVAGNQLYVSGNEMSLYPTRSDYELFYCCNDYNSVTDPDSSSGRAQQLPSRHPFPAITYTPTDMLRAVLLDRAGAWPRDPMDTRLLQFVARDAISSANPSTNPANDALRPPYSGNPPAAPADVDGDGMPDAWEIANGLNPNVANHNANHLSTAGYTDLEVYLHELSAIRMGQ